DSINYSCAYDSLFVCIYDIWDEYRSKWTGRMQRNSTYCALLADCFEAVHGGSRTIEKARDIVREMLTRNFPLELPQGPKYVSLRPLSSAMFAGNEWGTVADSCLRCGVRNINSQPFPTDLLITDDSSLPLRKKHKAAFGFRIVQSANRRCPSCGARPVTIATMREAPPLLFFRLPDRPLVLDPSIMLPVQGVNFRYHLRGVIYYADNHFTCRIIKGNGDFWYHDGI
ncbi:hypothetical protein B0H12DRAFT_972152, partial [Mycena haematopus]